MCDNALHRARLGSGIPLAEVTARTCLSPRIVQLIDDGQFQQLPGGLYARSYVRSFATVVGLDPEAVITELADRLPPDEDPLPMLRENARAYLPPFVRDIAQVIAAAKSWLSSRSLHVWNPSRNAAPQLRRLTASGIDLGIVGLCYVALIRLTAWMAGLDLRSALEVAGIAVAVVSVLVGLLYFLLFGGIGGRTAGAMICRLPVTHAPVRLRLRDVLHRALPLGGDAHSGAEASWTSDTQHLDPADSRV